MVSWSWVVYLFEPSDLSSRTSTTLTLFLAAVAFVFVVNDGLPKVPYLTIMDKFTLAAFLAVFSSGAESAFISIYYKARIIYSFFVLAAAECKRPPLPASCGIVHKQPLGDSAGGSDDNGCRRAAGART